MDLDEKIENTVESVKNSNSLKKYWKWAVLIILVIWGLFSYNGLVAVDEDVNENWNKVQETYQSRMDKVAVISKIVKKAAEHENKTLVEVVKARRNAELALKSNDFSKGKMEAVQNTQNKLTGSISSLMRDINIERYPDLKAVEAFRDFQSQYEGMENRISKARRDFGESVKIYNKKVRKMPSAIFAKLFGFDKKESFNSNPGAENISADDVDL